MNLKPERLWASTLDRALAASLRTQSARITARGNRMTGADMTRLAQIKAQHQSLIRRNNR